MCECLCTEGIQCPQRPEEVIGSPGIGVADGCELACGCWKSNLVLQKKKKSVFLAAEPSFFLFSPY